MIFMPRIVRYFPQCSVPCGDGGIRNRTVECKKKLASHTWAVLPVKECDDGVNEIPAQTSNCPAFSACHTWNVSYPCVSCGGKRCSATVSLCHPHHQCTKLHCIHNTSNYNHNQGQYRHHHYHHHHHHHSHYQHYHHHHRQIVFFLGLSLVSCFFYIIIVIIIIIIIIDH